MPSLPVRIRREQQDLAGSADSTFEQRTLPALTFGGQHFDIKLSSTGAFNHGSSAGIYQALATGLWSRPRIVAVKVFGQMLKPVQQEILVRELRTASHLLLFHPRILPFLGTAAVGDQKSLVSLYMENGNLLEYLKAHQGHDKKKLLLQVSEAVNYLHTKVCLAHGDLKCENVLISDSGDALLADFGLSTFVEKSQFAVATMTGIREMYTARFAAPEILLGCDDPAARPSSKTRESDVYAFGMLVLQAVTELPPWSDLTSMAVYHKVGQGQRPPRPKSRGFVSMSHYWWDVCQRCWTAAPERRPSMQSVLKLLHDGDMKPHRQLATHTGGVQSVAYFPSGRKVVFGSADGTVQIWDPVQSCAVSPTICHFGRIYCVAVSRGDHWICAGGLLVFDRWRAECSTLDHKTLDCGQMIVTSISFSPDGTRIVSAGYDGTVRLWCASTGEALLAPLEGHTDAIWSVAFSPDGAWIASASSDGTVRLWNGSTGAIVWTLEHGQSVFEVCFSPNGIHLVSASHDRVVRIWNIRTRLLARKITVHGIGFCSIAISPCGRYIASGMSDSTIRVWEAQTGAAVGQPLKGHTGRVEAVAFSPDGLSLVSGSYDSTLRVWDLF